MNDLNTHTETPFAGDFDKDVPSDLHDEIMERIVEAAWANESDDVVNILDVERRDACNIEFTGSVMIDGQEHSFHIRDGNNNGTEIIGWNDDSDIQVHEPDPRTLIPSRNEVSNAIFYERGESFLEAWELDKSGDGEHGKVLSSLPGSAGYDAFFAPGTGASRSHYEKAKDFGYEIGHESEALPLRRMLTRSIFKVLPDISEYPGGLNGEKPQAVLSHWSDLKDTSTEKGAAIELMMKSITDRMAKDGNLNVHQDEAENLKALGVIARKRNHEVALRKLLWSRMISFEAIEGFDSKDLPENPVAELFKTLDPGLVSSTKVVPSREIETLFENLCQKMSRSDTDTVDDVWYRAAERVGFRLVIAETEEPEMSDSPEP